MEEEEERGVLRDIELGYIAWRVFFCVGGRGFLLALFHSLLSGINVYKYYDIKGWAGQTAVFYMRFFFWFYLFFGLVLGAQTSETKKNCLGRRSACTYINLNLII